MRILGEDIGGLETSMRQAVGTAARGEIAQGPHAALAHHPGRRLDDGGEDAADAAGLIANRRIGERKVGLFQVAMAVDEQRHVA
ncbi:hypothetical protein ACRAVF_16940 [Bradyrhizobium oligotrophicum S58]